MKNVYLIGFKLQIVKNNQNNMGVNKVEKKQYLDRIKRLKERVLNTRPEMDLENAVLLTRGFKESEGQPLAIQKAYSFRKQCTEKTLKIIHVAGSNGKGSVCAYLNRILIQHGFRTGLFTSPHLVDVRERIRIDNEMVSKSDFVQELQ